MSTQELQSKIEQNKTAISAAYKRIAFATEELRQFVEEDKNLDVIAWMHGHVGREIAEMTALIARHQTLSEAWRIAGKSEQQTEKPQE